MTPRSVTFDVVGIAQPKGSTRAFMPKGARFPVVTSDNPRAKGWQQLVAEQARTVAAGGVFLGPVELCVAFYLPRPVSLPRRVLFHVKKPDLDKLLRATNDALTGILYRDDSQIVQIHASKHYAPVSAAPHAVITITDYTPPLVVAGALFADEVSAYEPPPIP